MSFRAEILKSGSFVNLDWIQGSAPVVSKSIETQYQIFSFQSSNVRLQVFDTKEIFRPGGSSEIVAEDEVKIYHSDVLIFHGVVDTIINWNPISGVLSFMVIGWLGQVNQLFAGRTSFPTAGSDFRYRYRKTSNEDYFLNGENVPVEYIAYPSVFETTWIADPYARSGYSKEWLFDSRALASSQVFDSEAFLYDDIGGVAVGSGKLWKRPESRGYLYEVSFSEILTNLATQLTQSTGDDYTVGSVDFGTITRDFSVPILLQDRDVFLQLEFVGIDEHIFCIAFEQRDPNEFSPTPAVRDTIIFRIKSKVELEDKGRFEFNLQAYGFGRFDTPWVSLQTAGFNNQLIEFIDAFEWHNLNFRSLRSVALPDGRILVSQLWSWIYIDIFPENNNVFVSNGAHCEFYIVTPSDGSVSGIRSRTLNIWNQNINNAEGDTFRINRFENITQLISDMEGNIPDLWKSLVFPSVLPAAGENFSTVEFSHATDNANDSIAGNGGRYFFAGSVQRGGFIAFQGSLTIDAVAFDFNGTKIVNVLLEMAKLTNSLFYIDDSKQVHFINRAYYNPTAVRDLEAVISVTSSAKTLKGSNLPVISSQIINNPEYNKALNDYYIDTYFPESVTMYSINCLDTASNIAIVLLDKVRFDYQSVSTVGIVQSFEIREGNMKILARAA